MSPSIPIQSSTTTQHAFVFCWFAREREREDAIGGGRAGSVHFMANGGVRNEKEKEKEEERSALARSLAPSAAAEE